jgi:hypothetical protein
MAARNGRDARFDPEFQDPHGQARFLGDRLEADRRGTTVGPRFLGSTDFDPPLGAMRTVCDPSRNRTIVEADTNDHKTADFGVE